MKKIIALIVTALIVIGVVAGATAIANRPETVVRNALTGVVEDFLARDEFSTVLKVAQQGSAELQASYGKDAEKISASGKIYFSQDSCYLENAKFESADFKASGSVYVSEDYSYIYSEDIFGGESWGIITGDLAKQFEDSIFAYGSESKYAIPDEKANDAIVDVLKMLDDDILKDLEKDLTKVTERYAKVVIKSIEKHAEYESEKDDVKVGGKRIDARVITVEIDSKDFVKIMEDIVKELEDDKELKKTVEKYSDYFEDALISAGVLEDGKDLVDYYEELVDQLSEAVEEMDDTIPEDSGMVMELVTPNLSAKLLKLSVYGMTDGKKGDKIIGLDVGEKGIKKTDTIEIEVGESTSYTFEISENTSAEYSASLEMTAYGTTSKVLKIDVDRKDKDFKVSFPDLNSIVVRGSYKKSSGRLELSLDSIKTGEEEIKDIDVTLILDEKDSPKNIIAEKNVKNILSITEADITKIATNVEKLLGWDRPSTNASTAVTCLRENGYNALIGSRTSLIGALAVTIGANTIVSADAQIDGKQESIIIFYFDNAQEAAAVKDSVVAALSESAPEGFTVQVYRNMVYAGTPHAIASANTSID